MVEADNSMRAYLGIPSPEQQKEYDQTQKRIQAKRDKFYGKTSAVQPIDINSLTPEGIALRHRVGSQPQILKPEATRLDSILSRIAGRRKLGRQQIIPFEEAKQVVMAIYEDDLINRTRTPYWTAESLAVVDDVTKYFIGDPTGPIPLTKCLYVYGAVGVGKTYLFRMMSVFCDVVPLNDMRFNMVSSKRLMRAIKNEQSLKPLSRIEQGSWLIDDLAAENPLTKIYGEDVDPMDELITSAYEAYIDNGKKTFWTSNRQPSELEGIYGTRNYDRFGEMNEAIYFPGESIRIDPNQLDEDEEL